MTYARMIYTYWEDERNVYGIIVKYIPNYMQWEKIGM